MPSTNAAASLEAPQNEYAITYLRFLQAGDEKMWPAVVFDDFGTMMSFFKTRKLFTKQEESSVLLDYLEYIRKNKGSGNDRVAVLLGHKTPTGKTCLFRPSEEIDFCTSLAKVSEGASKDLSDAIDMIQGIIKTDNISMPASPSVASGDTSQEKTIHEATEHVPESTASVDTSQDTSVLETSFEESEAMDDTLSFAGSDESRSSSEAEPPKKLQGPPPKKAAVTLGKKKVAIKALNRSKAAVQKKTSMSHKRKALESFNQNADLASSRRKSPRGLQTAKESDSCKAKTARKILETPQRSTPRFKNNAMARKEPILASQSPAPSIVSTVSTHEWALPLFTEIRPLLQKVGFKFQATYDCLPNVDPSKEQFVLDRDYFMNATRMRTYLCAYGIDCKKWCVGYEWSDEQKELIAKWVRMAIVPSLRHAKEIPVEARIPLKPSQLHSLLEKLGFRYRGSGEYYLPGVKPQVKHGISINGKQLKGENGMLVYLARFGLPPKTCKFENLTKEERLRLELHISDCDKDLDTFVKIEPEEDDPPIFGGSTEAESEDQRPSSSSKDPQSNEVSMGAPSSQVGAPEPRGKIPMQQPTLSYTSSSGSVAATLVTNSTSGEQHQASPRSPVASITDEVDGNGSQSSPQWTASEDINCEGAGLIAPLMPLTQPPCESRTGSPMSDDDSSYDEVRNDAVVIQQDVSAVIGFPKSPVEMVDRHCVAVALIDSDACFKDVSPVRCTKLFVESPDEKISNVSHAAERLFLESPDEKISNVSHAAERQGSSDSPLSSSETNQVVLNEQASDSGSPFDAELGEEIGGMLDMSDDQGTQVSDCIEKVFCGENSPEDGSSIVQSVTADSPARSQVQQSARKKVCYDVVSTQPDASPARFSEIQPMETDESMISYAEDTVIETDCALVSPKKITVAEKDEWSIVYEKMKIMGWEHAIGSGLVAYFFIPPGGKLKRKGGRLDEDYVEDIFGMQKYAYRHLGWGGDEDFIRELKELESRSSPEDGRSQRRQFSRQTNVSVETPSTRRPFSSRSDQKKAAEMQIETQWSGSASESDKEDERLSSESVTTKRSVKRAATVTSTRVSKKAKTNQLRAGHPDRMKTIGEKLKACQRALDTQFSLGTLSGVAGAGVNPEDQTLFQKNVGSLRSFLRAVVETEGAHGEERGDPACLYICGAPGVGKTSAVQWACKETELWASDQQSLNHLLLPSFCFINAADMQTTSNALKKIMEEIADALSLKGKRRTREGVEKALDSSQGGRRVHSCLVMVVDEIDLLLSERSKTSAVPSSSSEAALKMLCEWSATQNFRFALIGVSNSIGNQHVRRLQKFGLAHHTITFSSYRKEDLIQVVEDRVGCNIIDPKAIEFAAAKVAASCGDVRKLLELTSSAVSKCQVSLTPTTREETTLHKPIVTVRHMMLAVKETIPNHADIIDGLPQMAKIILCVAVTLTQAGPEWNVIRLGKLKNFCCAALREEMYDDDLTIETFSDLVQQLFDSGLLLSGTAARMDVSFYDYHSLYAMPIRLGVQLHDVESALEQTLGEQDFYRRLLENIRSTDLKNVK